MASPSCSKSKTVLTNIVTCPYATFQTLHFEINRVQQLKGQSAQGYRNKHQYLMSSTIEDWTSFWLLNSSFSFFGAQNNISFPPFINWKIRHAFPFQGVSDGESMIYHLFYKPLFIMKLFAADWGDHTDPICSFSRQCSHRHLLYIGGVEPGTYCPTMNNLTVAQCTVANS
jgi:hypothetical protein